MSRRLVVLTLLMSLTLICASSIMHLTNVGMGSANWPEAYGQIGSHEASMEAGKSDTAVAAIVSPALADRVHRVVANILELLIIAVLISAFRNRKSSPLPHPLRLPVAAFVLSLVLAFLGAWFGSPLRYPWIMMSNVIGGTLLFAIFWKLTLNLYRGQVTAGSASLGDRAVIGLLLLAMVIVLGAWTDAYYAALACKGLAGCQGQSGSIVDLWRGLFQLGMLEVDAAGKVVTDPAIAVAVHMAHRLAAIVAIVYLAWLGVTACRLDVKIRRTGLVLLVMLLIQASLGISAVLASMPLATVVLHNLFSALLVACVMTLTHQGGYNRL